MKTRGNVLGMAAMMLATAAIVAGCGSSSKSGTGGAGGVASGGAGGAAGAGGASAGVDAGVEHAAADSGAAGASAGDGGADRPADAPVDAAADGGGDTGTPTCGPFADGGMPSDAGITPATTTSFFVTSDTSLTANLGGLAGADARCQRLAMAAGLGAKTWHAYLSAEHGAGSGTDGGTTGAAVNARDRIGSGPWYNARGALLAADLASLHARTGDPTIFIDEHGVMINGQWTAAPTPLEHDILTGSNSDGTVAAGKTCSDWTSADGPPDGGVPDGGSPDGGSYFVARVGHTDGLGPRCSVIASWNSAHDNRGCNDTRPAGGAGRLYCFAIN